jgi:hypothetical protein
MPWLQPPSSKWSAPARASKALTYFIAAALIVLTFGVTIFVFGTLLSGCAQAPYTKRELLTDQILSPYPGHQGLVYPHCAEYAPEGSCSRWELREYVLDTPEVRARFEAADVWCFVGRELYRVCLDENALCSQTFGKRPFLGIIGKRPVIEKRLSFATQYQLLLDAPTVCGTDLERLRELL